MKHNEYGNDSWWWIPCVLIVLIFAVAVIAPVETSIYRHVMELIRLMDSLAR